MRSGRPNGGRGPDAALDLNTAFDRRDTLFTRAAEQMSDIVANPPSGPHAFDLLNGGIRELSSLMIRQLPLTTAREARLAHALCQEGIVEDTKALALGEGVALFLDRLQSAADHAGIGPAALPASDRDHALIRLERHVQTMAQARHGARDVDLHQALDAMAATPAQGLEGVLAKLRACRTAMADQGNRADRVAPLLNDAVAVLERMALREAVARFDSAADAFEAAMPKALPSKPTERMLAAGAKAGSVALDAARRIYQAMASEFLSPRKGVGE
ncbi:hypothetical protein Sp245p_20530 (plasmid) [Azospirillum baldaniorum]|uniref:Uncharacterized protein n=1 Tax=Azospirillum baldaniorum TaxID=1064539 RepID=A0A9P1NP72_9PROT|nr:hypothetical protein [Azospirillum baldaniorum]AWJ92166.1 hypothetical protein Sp245p_20530 [Azospirillum baldaniorum]TWA58633.1 hypothetical protein FBZ84_11724 [Azospirillum baldaniorum]TWA73570.1 hypothetical protein FBZ85_11525 [Azospirillum brasilense]CCD00649.1 protein of unknown function [Azospirillum baldaniorum]